MIINNLFEGLTIYNFKVIHQSDTLLSNATKSQLIVFGLTQAMPMFTPPLQSRNPLTNSLHLLLGSAEWHFNKGLHNDMKCKVGCMTLIFEKLYESYMMANFSCVVSNLDLLTHCHNMVSAKKMNDITFNCTKYFSKKLHYLDQVRLLM